MGKLSGDVGAIEGHTPSQTFVVAPYVVSQIKFVASKIVMDSSKLKPVDCIILSYFLQQIILHWVSSLGQFISAIL